ncbi:hypothetical protein [Nocardiopsis lucentensis]|uniref:hypothetical protein n=1 Tax=Nocardiopsis lucentensis TaxID=53441 RepID=UPI00034970F9|nr:hypothetical protein [Nocardiopsis lucentensis]
MPLRGRALGTVAAAVLMVGGGLMTAPAAQAATAAPEAEQTQTAALLYEWQHIGRYYSYDSCIGVGKNLLNSSYFSYEAYRCTHLGGQSHWDLYMR